MMQEFRTQHGVAVGTGVSFTQVAGEFSAHYMTMTPTISSQTHGINNRILNCPYTSRDIHKAKAMFEPCCISLKEKATHRSGRSASSSIFQVPQPTILQRYGQIGLFSDVMYVSSLAFVLTISSDLRYYSVAPAYGPGGRSGRNLLTMIQ